MTPLEVLTILVRALCLLALGAGAYWWAVALWHAHLRGLTRVRSGAYRHAAPPRGLRWRSCSSACSEAHTFRAPCERALTGGRL